jgi:MFS family permease
MALTDGVGKAYISKLVPHEVSASAFGIYQTAMGVATLMASVTAGFLWTNFGPRAPFYFGATMAVLAEMVFFGLSKRLKLNSDLV